MENTVTTTAKSAKERPPKSVKFLKSKKKSPQNERQIGLEKIAQEQKRIRDQLTREIKYSELSHRRGIKDWEQWCEDATFINLQSDLKAVAQSLNRVMDKSDHAVDVIKMHREHAEEQYLRNFYQHTELIDYILDIFKTFHNSMYQMFELERERLIADFYNENLWRENIFRDRKTYFENLMHAMVTQFKGRLTGNDEKLIERRYEIESWSIEKRDQLMEHASRIKALSCQEIKGINTKKWPRAKFKEFSRVEGKCAKSDKEIDEAKIKIHKKEKIIKKLNEKLQTASHEKLIKLTELRSEYNFIFKLLKVGELKLQDEAILDHEKLRIVVLVSEKKKKILEKKLSYGKTILSAVKICAKFEKFNEIFELPGNDTSDDDCQNSIDSFMENFMKRLAKVESDCVILRNRKSQLASANEHLDKMISLYDREFQAQENISMLQLDLSPSIGKISQISHHMSQIQMPIKIRKGKLCKSCNKALSKFYY